MIAKTQQPSPQQWSVEYCIISLQRTIRKQESFLIRCPMQIFDYKVRCRKCHLQIFRMFCYFVGVYFGKRKSLLACQSKLYPQQDPLYPFDCKAISKLANSVIFWRHSCFDPSSFSLSGCFSITLYRLQYPERKSPMPLALYSFGTSANLRKFIGHRLKPCITTNLHTADFFSNGNAWNTMEFSPSYGSHP